MELPIGPARDDHRIARRLALIFVFAWFSVGGVAHFVFTDVETRIVPSWLPAHRLIVLISGCFEVLGALGLLLKPTRRLSGWGLILLTLAVTPANVYMWQHPSLFPTIPVWLLAARLPFQVGLLACIWWSTRP